MRESVTVRITSADTMTAKEARDAANWLKARAEALIKDRFEYDRVHTARYYTEESSNDRSRTR